MPFVFVSPAYAERDKHSSLYEKLTKVCDLWIMNDVVKLEEYQPPKQKQLVYKKSPAVKAEQSIADQLKSHSAHAITNMPTGVNVQYNPSGNNGLFGVACGSSLGSLGAQIEAQEEGGCETELIEIDDTETKT